MVDIKQDKETPNLVLYYVKTECYGIFGLRISFVTWSYKIYLPRSESNNTHRNSHHWSCEDSIISLKAQQDYSETAYLKLLRTIYEMIEPACMFSLSLLHSASTL